MHLSEAFHANLLNIIIIKISKSSLDLNHFSNDFFVIYLEGFHFTIANPF